MQAWRLPGAADARCEHQPQPLHITEKRVTGSFAYTGDDFRTVIDMMADGRLDPAPLITSRIQLADALEKAFAPCSRRVGIPK